MSDQDKARKELDAEEMEKVSGGKEECQPQPDPDLDGGILNDIFQAFKKLFKP